MNDEGKPTFRGKIRALRRVAGYRPRATVTLVVFSAAVAALEGVGLGFIVPIVEVVQSADATPTGADGLLGAFFTAYARLGLPFTLGYLVVGVVGVMTVRYTASFLVSWMNAWLHASYVRDLQYRAYEAALGARIAYFDEEGSDEILNAIVTQANYAGDTINQLVSLLQQLLLITVYLAVTLYVAPMVTIGTVLVLGFLIGVSRLGVRSGYDLGERVAAANERIQMYAQAGTQGIRDVRLFGITSEFLQSFADAVDEAESAKITSRRNQAFLQNYYRLLAAAAVFVLVYVAVAIVELSLSALGIYLFAMFRLAPQISGLNNTLYRIDRDLPHLVRTQSFIDDLKARQESTADAQVPVPSPVTEITFDDVHFSYAASETETALRGVSFTVEAGSFIAFVGPSGAGKTTIASLLARLYEPTAGTILANDVDVQRFNRREWRSMVAVVRQSPYIFNETLRWNVTVANRDATDAEVRRACEAAQVTEFLPELPDGYETVLGDEGVRLSGGQRQRVAIARALLQDADVLVLDEATSDLDATLEAKIYDAITASEIDRILIVIAHRLSTITDADNIYVLEDGRILEHGKHEPLLDKGGTYEELYATQSSLS